MAELSDADKVRQMLQNATPEQKAEVKLAEQQIKDAGAIDDGANYGFLSTLASRIGRTVGELLRLDGTGLSPLADQIQEEKEEAEAKAAADAKGQRVQFKGTSPYPLSASQIAAVARKVNLAQPFQIDAWIGGQRRSLIVQSDPWIMRGRGGKQMAFLGNVLRIKNEGQQPNEVNGAYQFQLVIDAGSSNASAMVVVHQRGADSQFGAVLNLQADPQYPLDLLKNYKPLGPNDVMGEWLGPDFPLIYPYASFKTSYDLGSVVFNPFGGYDMAAKLAATPGVQLGASDEVSADAEMNLGLGVGDKQAPVAGFAANSAVGLRALAMNEIEY